MLVLGSFDQVRLLAHGDEVEKQDWIVTRCLTYFILTLVSAWSVLISRRGERSADVRDRDG